MAGTGTTTAGKARANRKKSAPYSVVPRLRILRDGEIALGPGKAKLLEAIVEAGTIAAAARRCGMSYNRAWILVQTMNRCFKEPLVEARRGGAVRGGTVLSEAGRQALALYRRMEHEAEQAVARTWATLRTSLKD
jgi:molybdate transport system regulatory protein